MARQETDHEDLLGEATALAERVELAVGPRRRNCAGSTGVVNTAPSQTGSATTWALPTDEVSSVPGSFFPRRT